MFAITLTISCHPRTDIRQRCDDHIEDSPLSHLPGENVFILSELLHIVKTTISASFCVCVHVVLGFELRALCLLGILPLVPQSKSFFFFYHLCLPSLSSWD
jgi:hypothetical protein